MAKTKNKNFLSYAEAKVYMLGRGVKNSMEYRQWHNRNHPVKLPKCPDKTYKGEFEGWRVFLCVELPPDEAMKRKLAEEQKIKEAKEAEKAKAKDKPKRQWMSYEEAKAFAKTMHFSTSYEWKAFSASDTYPKNIPKAPDMYYPEWRGWKDFLGSAHFSYVESKRQEHDNKILYVIHFENHPINIVKIGIENNGKNALLLKQQRYHFRIVKIISFANPFDWQEIVNRHSEPWWEDSTFFAVNNIYELCYELDLSS